MASHGSLSLSLCLFLSKHEMLMQHRMHIKVFDGCLRLCFSSPQQQTRTVVPLKWKSHQDTVSSDPHNIQQRSSKALLCRALKAHLGFKCFPEGLIQPLHLHSVEGKFRFLQVHSSFKRHSSSTDREGCSTWDPDANAWVVSSSFVKIQRMEGNSV